MLSSNEIKETKFSTGMGGYKKDEVDELLDRVAADYDDYNRALKKANSKIDSLNSEIEKLKASESSIQNVLVSAQKLADSIVEEAKVKSAKILKDAEQSISNITDKERELSAAFERKASMRKAEVERELQDKVEKLERKSAAVEKATADSVERQQRLFDKIKIEIAAFKAEINKSYKEHLEALAKIPDEVPSDPRQIAAAVSEAFDRAPLPEKFLPQTDAQEEKPEAAEKAEPAKAEEKTVNSEKTENEPLPAPVPVPNKQKHGGFIVTTEDD